MQLTQFLLTYAISIPIFIVCDLLWLGVIARSFYQDRLGHLLGEVNWPAAIIFYFIFLFGLNFFVLRPALQEGGWLTAVGLGLLFGFVTYATYDLTNWATLRDWPASVVVVDILWGAILGMLVSAATYFVYTKIFS